LGDCVGNAVAESLAEGGIAFRDLVPAIKEVEDLRRVELLKGGVDEAGVAEALGLVSVFARCDDDLRLGPGCAEGYDLFDDRLARAQVEDFVEAVEI
jgi:hypothetical protein